MRLRVASIWGPGSVHLEDARVSGMLRRYLPEYYLGLVLFGILGALGGVPALRDTFGENYANLVALLLAVCAAVAGASEAFPSRLWWVEYYAVVTLSVLIVIYGAAIALAGVVGGDLGRAAVGAEVYASAVLARWRVTDIARDRRVHGWRFHRPGVRR